MNWLKRLFKRKDDEVYFADGPAYEPGDLVIVYDPYVLDGMDAHEVREPRYETVKQSAFIPNLGVFAYQFEGGDGAWYNEAWLFPAVYLTERISVVFPYEPTQAEQIDALLDEYRDYKALADTFGDAEYCERLAELRRLGEK
ncbi:hypothetical protein [Cytobacillus solani]|uniref:Uncharacterized protein n=1 Tax=Cytobacillus solani TaxID=1637975 RepID=A0A0Q3QM48_9BACI|nr:hypothetical protein [Cytobacillus solani]KQL18814.1 hypothetical protein AN957_09680 [Cytobacillus solani]